MLPINCGDLEAAPSFGSLPIQISLCRKVYLIIFLNPDIKITCKIDHAIVQIPEAMERKPREGHMPCP